MRFKDLFSRNASCDVKSSQESKTNQKNLINCDNAKIKELITDWTANEGWAFEDFAKFLEQIGLKMPVTLSQYDENQPSFKCTDSACNEIRISLFFGDGFDYCSEIRTIEAGENSHYIVNGNSSYGERKPTATLESKTIRRNGKELNCYYSNYSCHHKLRLDDNYMLEIRIHMPYKSEDRSEILALRNNNAIEEYLMELDNSLIIDDVFEKMKAFLGFTKDDLRNCREFLIAHVERYDEELVRQKILIEKGKMQEYAILKNDETFHVFRDGNWEYISDSGIVITYVADEKKYVISLLVSENNAETINSNEILNRVKERISEIQEFVQ